MLDKELKPMSDESEEVPLLSLAKSFIWSSINSVLIDELFAVVLISLKVGYTYWFTES